MKRLALAAFALVALAASAGAQTIPPGTNPVPAGGAFNSSPPTITSGQAGWLQIDSTGNLRVTGTVTATVTPTNPLGITPTDRTITSATGASQTMMAANAARHSLTISNTGNANCGVNPTGGTAVIGGAGTITLAPLGSYTPRIPTLSAVTVICTSGQPIYGDEN